MACTTQVQEVRSLRYLFEEYGFDTARRQLCRGPDVMEMSRSLLNYVGPTLPGMNVTRPS